MFCRSNSRQSVSLPMSKDPRRPPSAPVRPPGPSGVSQGTSAGPDREPVSPEEVARYIAQFSAELSSLAKDVDFSLLAYLLDMARLEAMQIAQALEVEP